MDRDFLLGRARAQLTLLRVRAGGVCQAVVVPGGPLWLGSHWVEKRQVLCCAGSAEACMLCGESASRVTGFVLVMVSQLNGSEVTPAQQKRLMLLELSPLSWSGFEMSARFEGLDPCGPILADISRKGARSPLRIECVRAVDGCSEVDVLGRALVDAVAVLFGLPLVKDAETAEQWRDRVAPVVARLAAVKAATLPR